MTGYSIDTRDLEGYQNAAALSTMTVFCGNILCMETSLRKTRRRVKKGLLAVSPSYNSDRVRKERRDRQIVNTMCQKMVPAALGLNLFGFSLFDLFVYDGVRSTTHGPQPELGCLRQSQWWNSQGMR